MARWLGRIVVGLTLCLISFIAYSSQIFIIWPWYGRELSVELLTLLAPFKYVHMHASCWSLAYNNHLKLSRRDAIMELLALYSYRPWSGSQGLATGHAV
jgi:hypothetical protein